MSLGSVIVAMLESEKEYVSLTPQQTEDIIEDFVLKVSEPINDYRTERKVSPDALAQIGYR